MTPPDNSIYDGDIQVDSGQVSGPPSPPPSPHTSPSPSPHTEEIQKLNKSLRRLKDQNKRLQRKVNKEKKRAEKYRKQSVRQKATKITVREKYHLPPRKKLINEKKAQVESFLLLDENSTVLPGKKDTVCRKEKRQSQVLTSSLKYLHKAYVQKCEKSTSCPTDSS